jgi:N-acetylmuramoyl-L-alanine amidase
MIYKLLIYPLLISFALICLVKPLTADERAPMKQDRKAKTIYIDPSYGGWEIGPVFGQGLFGKTGTLKIARHLQALLTPDGFNVILSRTGDQFVALDQRVLQAHVKNADFSLVLKTSGAIKDCIQIRTMPPPSTSGRQKPDERKTDDLKGMREEIGNILQELAADSNYKESRRLAELMAKKLRQYRELTCVTQGTGKDYVLVNTAMPVVMVDFGISSKADRQPSLMEPASQENAARSLYEAMKEYADSRVARQITQ